MKGKMSIIAGLVSMFILSNIASATSIQTRINITNGSAIVKHTVNNQTLEIETNESASIFTEIKDSILNFFVNATGKGSLKTDLSGNYSVNATVDDEAETHTGMGVFSTVYEFFKKIFFFGWVKLRI